jgi:hypothetical protein
VLRDSEPRMTVLTRASSNLSDRQTDRQHCLGRYESLTWSRNSHHLRTLRVHYPSQQPATDTTLNQMNPSHVLRLISLRPILILPSTYARSPKWSLRFKFSRYKFVPKLSRYSDRLWAGGRVRFPERAGIFVFSTASRVALGQIQTPVQWAPGRFHWGQSGMGVKLTTHLHLK